MTNAAPELAYNCGTLFDTKCGAVVVAPEMEPGQDF